MDKEPALHFMFGFPTGIGLFMAYLRSMFCPSENMQYFCLVKLNMKIWHNL